MGYIRETYQKKRGLWIWLAATITSAVISIVVSYVNVSYWETRKTESMARTVYKDIKKQLDYLTVGLNEQYFDMNIDEGSMKIKLKNFMMPDKTLWSFYDQHLYFDILENITVLPPKSIAAITTYHRMATKAKNKNDKLMSDINDLIGKGVSVKGLMKLFPDGDEKKLEEELQKVKMARILYDYFGLRASTLLAISSGFYALAMLNYEVLNNTNLSKSYIELSNDYEFLAKEELVRVSKTVPFMDERAKGFFQKLYHTFPKDLRDLLKSMGKAYGEPLPIQQ